METMQPGMERTPREIVAELDRHVIGQEAAKRAMALALRDRWRRAKLPEALRAEVRPRNILLLGPTGVGKTELARRLAHLAAAPFTRVEASRYTEVGYVGRDVESMIRDLVDHAVALVRQEHEHRVRVVSRQRALERTAALLHEQLTGTRANVPEVPVLVKEIESGKWAEQPIQVPSREEPESLDGEGADWAPWQERPGRLTRFWNQLFPPRPPTRELRVSEALVVLQNDEVRAQIDREQVVSEALERAQNAGIVFIDEIDKVAGRGGTGQGPEVSRQGVQRDLLPIIEGTSVETRWGVVTTDGMLFIAAGAFQMTRPSDLIPELQGRFPVRVELQSLGVQEYGRILTEPAHSLLTQQVALLQTEGISLRVTPSGVQAMAEAAHRANLMLENIGARRLHTILERVFDEVSFHAPDMLGAQVEISAEYVESRLGHVLQSEDVSRYIL
jgi:ATP-dependent HslUV protease ATP-binding subunit HslU